MPEQKNISLFYNEINNRLEAVRRKQLNVNILTGVIISFIIFLSLAALSVVAESIFGFNVTGRTILFLIICIAPLAALGFFSLPPVLIKTGLLKPEDNYTSAGKVGNIFPEIRDRLLNAIQIYEYKLSQTPLYSFDLIDASFSELYGEVKSVNFQSAVNDKLLKNMRRMIFYTSGVVLLVFFISPAGFIGSANRLINFSEAFAATPKIILHIEPGNIEAVRGETVSIVATTEGNVPAEINLFTREEGVSKFENHSVKLSELISDDSRQEGVFKFSVPNIRSTTYYYASVDEVKTELYKINVLDRPFIRSLQLVLTYPSYSRLSQKKLDENLGDVSAFPGTRINFEIKPSKNLSYAKILFSDGGITDLKVTDGEVNGAIILTKEKDYSIRLKDENGLENIDAIEYKLKIIPDEYPFVEIRIPGRNVDITENMILNMQIRIKDDFGFSKLRLGYRLVQSRYEQPSDEFSYIDIPLTKDIQVSSDLWYEWNMTSLNLVPEDVLAYYAEVFDNDNINGPKSARSEMYLVRLPSLDEVFADVSESQRQSLETLQNIAKEAEKLRKELNEFQHEMKKNQQKMDWAQQKKAEELTKKYQELQQKVAESAQQMEEMIDKMEENKLLSPQTLEKYLELQKLMDQLKNPELQEAMKKLQERMQQMTPEQMKQAMQQMNFTEEQFKQSLERTLELLKRIHIEQKIEELIRRTEELVKQQQELKEQASRTSPSEKEKSDQLARQQEDIQKQIEKLEQETKNLKEKMEEFPKDMPLDKMDQAEKSLGEKQLQQKSQQSSQQMKSGQMKKANQNQQEVQQGLEDFLSQMQDVKESLQEQMQREVLNQMRKAVQNLLELSKRQEELKEETKNLNPNSQRFRENAQEQMEMMDNLNNVADMMGEISKKSFAMSPEMGKEIGNAMRQMAQSLQNMEQRNPSGSAQQQSEAMGSCNRAAMMMQGAINSMKQMGGGMGMAGLMQRLGQMSGMQAGINAQTSQAMGNQGMSAQQKAEYSRLAGEQGSARKSLEQLANEARNMGELSKLLGDLDRIAKDMQEVQTDLEQGNVNPETQKKQERILSRLLDSQKSMRERDYEKRRRGETGKDFRNAGPPDFDLTSKESKNRLREELLKILDEKYSKDYEDMIRKYFEELEKIQTE